MSNTKSEIVAKLILELAPGLSTLGTKTLTINRSHGLKVHDTGGMGEARTLKIKEPTLENLQVLPMAKGRMLLGIAKFDKDVSTAFEILDNVADTADALWQMLPESDCDFDSKFPICVRGSFSKSLDEFREGLHKSYTTDVTSYQKLDLPKAAEKGSLSGWFQKNVTDGLRVHNWHHFYGSRLFEPRADIVCCELARHNEFYSRVKVKDGRLTLHRGKHSLLDLSLDVLGWERDQKDRRIIKLHNQVTIASEMVKELALYFPSVALTEKLASTLGKPSQPDKVGQRLSDIVRMTGRLHGNETVDEKVDALLTDHKLEFRSVKSGKMLLSLPFKDPTLRIAGTSDNFLLFNSSVGPLTISEGSAPFREQLNDHSEIRRAAQTSLKSGPFALNLNEQGVILRLDGETLHLKSLVFDGEVALSSIESIQSHYLDSGTATLEIREASNVFTFEGKPEQAEAFHTALLSRLIGLKESFQAEEASKAILGLEGDYFLYSIFAPFLHLDRVLHSGDKKDDLNWLALMAQGVANLSRHLDAVCQFLPCYVASQDRNLLKSSAANLQACKQQERELRKAVHGVNALVGDISRIRSLVSSRTGLRESKADYGPLAISLVGASLFSPLCLLAGAQHAYGATTREEQQGKLNKELLQRTRGEVQTQWQLLINEKLPLLSYHVVEDIFGVRIRLAKHISKSKEPEKLQTALAKRLARLKTFLLFPEDPGMDYTRGHIVKEIKARREAVFYDGFVSF